MKKTTVKRMDRSDFVLAVLSTANGALFRPVHVQKLFFLIDREIPKEVGGPYFAFQPYNYGPFDSDVYRELEALAALDLVEIMREYNWSDYRLTNPGQEKGEELLATFPEKAREYISTLSQFVRSLSFSQLVSAIYKAYPDMKQHSIF